MTDQDYGAVLYVQDQPRRGDVAAQRDRWVLHDADVEPVLLQDLVDAGPARAVNEATMNQTNVVDPRHGRVLAQRLPVLNARSVVWSGTIGRMPEPDVRFAQTGLSAKGPACPLSGNAPMSASGA